MGGRRLPPGDIILMADGVAIVPSWPVTSAISVLPCLSVFGMASVIGGGEPRLGSGTYDEADDRSDLILLVRAVMIDGSELPEEPMASGDDTYDESADKGSTIGDTPLWTGSGSVLDNEVTCLVAGVGVPCAIGDTGGASKGNPGVGGGIGGWSSEDGRLVLM